MPLHPEFTERIAELGLKQRRELDHVEDATYQHLSYPNETSPFLVLAERQHGDSAPPSRVFKVLVVPSNRGNAYAFWSGHLNYEFARLRKELALPPGTERTFRRLNMPFSSTPVVERGSLRLPAHELFSDVGIGVMPDVTFDYVVRPYIPWPQLRNAGYPPSELDGIWLRFASEKGIPEDVRKDEEIKKVFINHVLVCGAYSPEPHPAIFLTSYWRFAYRLDESPEKGESSGGSFRNLFR
jgi:hypothetical protein